MAFWGCLDRLAALPADARLGAPLPSASGFPLVAGGWLRSKVSFLVPQPLLLPPGPVLLLGSRSAGLMEALSFGEAHVLRAWSAPPSPGTWVSLEEELPAGWLLSGGSREVKDLSIRISSGGGGRCSGSSSVSQLELRSSLLDASAVSTGGRIGAKGLQSGPTLRGSLLAAGEICGFGYKGASPL